MSEFEAPSGAAVVVNEGGWDEAVALRVAIAGELANANLGDFKLTLDADAELDLAKLVQLALKVDASPAVADALFKCLGRCTYNGQRITKATFEPRAARGDYYPIAIACLKENIGPFFEPLLSKLSPVMERMQATIVALK